MVTHPGEGNSEIKPELGRKDIDIDRKACPVALRLHRKIKQRCRLNMVKVSLLPLPDEDLREAGPNGRKPSYYLHHK